jgi:putative aldouronate transport system substrate-binding protein
VIRQDWLDDLGLEAPVTYDDWENVLTEFKNAYSLDEPILMSTGGFFSGGSFIGGYGVLGQNFSTPFDRYIPFYQVDGKVKFGPLESGYEEYITMLSQWYQKGLFNDDFLLESNGNFMDATYIAKVTTGKVGVASANTNSIQSLIDSGEGEGFMLSALSEPVKNMGDVYHFSNYSSRVSGELLSVSTNCENVELAMNWLDLGYTQEGARLVNYGVEGYSYELDADGNPVFTDIIVNNPDYAFSVALANLVPRFTAGYTIVKANDVAYSDLVFEAIETWGRNMDGAYVYPSGATMSVEETEEFNSIYSDISTYLDENAARFIIGDLPLSSFDSFRSDLEAMGIDRCIELEQAALDRYLTK